VLRLGAAARAVVAPAVCHPFERGVPILRCHQRWAVDVLPLGFVARSQHLAETPIRTDRLDGPSTAVRRASDIDRILDHGGHRLLIPVRPAGRSFDPLGVELHADRPERTTSGLAEDAPDDWRGHRVDLQADRAALLVLDRPVAVGGRAEAHDELAGELGPLTEGEANGDVLALVDVDRRHHRLSELAGRRIVELVVHVPDGDVGPLEGALKDGQLADVAGQSRGRQGDQHVELALLPAFEEVEQIGQVPVGAAANLAVDQVRRRGCADPLGETQALLDLAVQRVAVLFLARCAHAGVDGGSEGLGWRPHGALRGSGGYHHVNCACLSPRCERGVRKSWAVWLPQAACAFPRSLFSSSGVTKSPGWTLSASANLRTVRGIAE